MDVEDLADPDICLTCPLSLYPPDALLPADRVGAVLAGLRALRFADENVYLRSASVNIISGLVSLHFSCDDSHYELWSGFLERDIMFWVGG